MMGVELGNYITGIALFFIPCFVAGCVVATSTNVAGAFGDRDRKRGPLDWLLWVVVVTATFWLVGQGIYWWVHLGRAIQGGTFLPGSG